MKAIHCAVKLGNSGGNVLLSCLTKEAKLIVLNERGRTCSAMSCEFGMTKAVPVSFQWTYSSVSGSLTSLSGQYEL